MDLFRYPFPSRRTVVLGHRFGLATSQPLAALAGLEIYLQGGGAVDAALAAAIALTVVEPTSNGIGGDALATLWDGEAQGLNSTGKSPLHLPPLSRLDERGWAAVTVPGAVAAWRALWERWGRLPFEALFAPAIRYAREGFALSPEVARSWKRAEGVYLPLEGEVHRAFREVFFPEGRAPAPGEVVRLPLHAETLEEIARTGGESFYRGALAEALLRFSEATGGYLSREDLLGHAPEWVRPLSTSYRGYTVHELPPSTQGVAVLLALNLLEGFDLKGMGEVERLHVQLEAMKLALSDTYRHVADPAFMEVSPEAFLDKAYAEERRRLIGRAARPWPDPGLKPGGTVYLAAADGERMVSFIQSNYMGFGAGILVPGTGIALHNRGAGFTLEPDHPNRLAPGKRPFHTLIPGFLSREGRPLGPFGVMGGLMQPQGHVQVLVHLLDLGHNPQAALDAPRWQVAPKEVLLEPGFGQALALALKDLGHPVRLEAEMGLFGRGQIILRVGEALALGTDPRADGLALAL
jgi:gamma-glutamyltranspeptidase/glutathione hydrolase